MTIATDVDITDGLRLILKAPAFTTAAIVSLAIGTPQRIGAGVAAGSSGCPRDQQLVILQKQPFASSPRQLQVETSVTGMYR